MDLPVFITMPDGHVEEVSQTKLLLDGTCLISDDGKYYHTHCGCCYKWNDEVYHNWVRLGGWKLTTIEEAKKQGLLHCLLCKDEEYERIYRK